MASPYKEATRRKGVILGWRHWNLSDDKDTLVSPFKNAEWNRSVDRVRIKEGSHAGLYAYHEHGSLSSRDVIGLVAGGGKVFIHQNGFRAERMQILGLVNQSIDFPQWVLDASDKEEYLLSDTLEIKGKDRIHFMSSEEIIKWKRKLSESEDFFAMADDKVAERLPLPDSRYDGYDDIFQMRKTLEAKRKRFELEQKALKSGHRDPYTVRNRGVNPKPNRGYDQTYLSYYDD